MADEVAEQMEEGAQGDQDRRTMTYMLEHPEEAPQFTATPQDEETPEEQGEAAAAGALETETPEEKAARETVEAEAAAKSEQEVVAAKPKFTTLEEYHKAYPEAERRMHEATTETVKERAAREAAEKRAAELEAKLAEQERLAAEAAKPKPLTEEEQDEIFAKAAEELSDLDNDDPNYLKNYGKIWRKAIAAAGQHRIPPDPELTAEEVANKAWEKIQAKQAAEAAKTAEQREREEAERIEAKARELGIKAGLDLADPESADSIIWDRLKQKIPQEIFDKGTLESQVEWVAAGVRQKTGKIVEQTDAERQQALAAQKGNAVLGKGVNYTPSKETPKTRTMSEMLQERASLGHKL